MKLRTKYFAHENMKIVWHG